MVGDRAEVQEFIKKAGGDTRKAEETNMLPYLLGLVLGISLGLIPFRLANGVDVKLGTAGGAFLVSLLIGHFGRIGPLRLYVPAAAKNLTRELGLMLFLAGAGTTAGAQLVQVIQKQGWSLLLAGAVITHSLGSGCPVPDHQGFQAGDAWHAGRADGCHDQPARAFGCQQPDRHRPGHPGVCQCLSGRADLQDPVCPDPGDAFAAIFRRKNKPKDCTQRFK